MLEKKVPLETNMHTQTHTYKPTYVRKYWLVSTDNGRLLKSPLIDTMHICTWVWVYIRVHKRVIRKTQYLHHFLEFLKCLVIWCIYVLRTHRHTFFEVIRCSYLGSRNLKGSAGYWLLTVAISSAHLWVNRPHYPKVCVCIHSVPLRKLLRIT